MASAAAPPKDGATTAIGLIGLIAAITSKRTDPRLLFVVPGTPTSSNPVKAVAQGLSGEASDRGYLLRGCRCTRCGFVELYATEATPI